MPWINQSPITMGRCEEETWDQSPTGSTPNLTFELPGSILPDTTSCKSTPSRTSRRQYSSDRESNNPEIYPTGNMTHPQAKGYSNSVTWESRESKEKKAFTLAQHAMERYCSDSPYRFDDFTDWLDHRQGMMADAKRRNEIYINNREQEKALRSMGIPPLARAFNGIIFEGNRGAVLGEETIWCTNFLIKREIAPWPDLSEMKWEGDDRARTKVGRFLALPRFQQNVTVAWHQLRHVHTYGFDKVRKPPTLEDILLPVDEIDDTEIPRLLNHDLLKELDLCEDY